LQADALTLAPENSPQRETFSLLQQAGDNL